MKYHPLDNQAAAADLYWQLHLEVCDFDASMSYIEHLYNTDQNERDQLDFDTEYQELSEARALAVEARNAVAAYVGKEALDDAHDRLSKQAV